MERLGIWKGCTTKSLNSSTNDGADDAEQPGPRARTARRAVPAIRRGGRGHAQNATALRLPGFGGAEERSRSVCCASVSIGRRAYPAALWTPGARAQLSRFSLIFAALPRSSRR